MTLERAREMITQQLRFGGGYNRIAVRLLLGEVQREHGRAAVDGLVLELDLETAFGLNPGTDFSGVGRCGAKPSAAVWRRAVADSAAADKYDGFVTGARPCV